MLTGDLWARLLQAGVQWLTAHEAAINHLNVFPVPDGDTGSNLRLTLEAAARAVVDRPGMLSVALSQSAAAAFLGARGNSGVILSLILEGLHRGVADRHQASVSDLTEAWKAARAAAYAGVSQPREGTILTAITRVADSWEKVAPEAPLLEAFVAAAQAAHQAVEESPLLLPVLQENGVVDAGAAGFSIWLAGMVRLLRGQPFDTGNGEATIDGYLTVKGIDAAAHDLEEQGYCTSFLIRGVPPDASAFRELLIPLGGSLVVATTDALTKVHIHTEHPGQVLELSRVFGELTRIEILNMREQVASVRAEAVVHEKESEMAVVAVVPSEGIAQVFASSGATAIRTHSGTMNPSIEELLQAVERTRARTVFLLPNNGNVLAAAEQIQRRNHRRITIIPTRSVVQGASALIAFLPDHTPEENAKAMYEAFQRVISIDITTSSRPVVILGKEYPVGTPIALVDEKLALAAPTLEDAAVEAIAPILRSKHSMLTIFTGDSRTPDQAQVLQERLQAAYPQLEIQMLSGGQPVYAYLLGLE
ncbi:MAG: DAK2 domain-containing protein [Chloroflexi bacterium]|nr:DAK2 domain-containing protein [Chloroflexota bacterium]